MARFILARTVRAAPPLLPEVALQLSSAEPTALWEESERATGRTDLPPPFWAYPWAGGTAVARYLLDHPGLVAGRTVLDLASGSGLVAIAAALAGASRVTGNDIDPMALAAIKLNAAANGVTVETSSADLLAPPPGPGCPAGPLYPAGLPLPGLVVAGDACYERRMAHRLLAFLRRARAAGADTLLGDPGRTYLPATGLRSLASYPVPSWPGLEEVPVRQATVWELAG